MGCVHQAKNKINGKCYIGKTITSLEKRKNGHLYDASKRLHRNTYFVNSIRKYGLDGFEWSILIESNNNDLLLQFERDFIKLLDTRFPTGYNMSEGGDNPPSTKGRHDSYETRLKKSQARMGMKFSKEHIEKLRLAKLGTHYTMSEQTKQKIGKANSIALLNHVPWNKGMRGFNSGLNHPMYGKHHKDESKIKMRLAKLGRLHTEEHNKKISQANIIRWQNKRVS
jgi:group I intron endonuclease